MKNLKGATWTGIYHNNACGINCKKAGNNPGEGQCEFLYFSNGSVTVCINTNGRKFDREILKRIQDSFSFNK